MNGVRLWVLLGALLAPALAAQQDTAAAPAGAPVVFDGDTLFYVRARLGPFAPDARARAIVERLRRVADDPRHAADSVSVADEEGVTDILVGDVAITTVTELDAAAAGLTRAELAAERARAIADALRGESLWAIARTALVGLLLTLVVTAALAALVWLLARGFGVADRTLVRWQGSRIRAIRIQRLELLSAARATSALRAVARGARVVAIVVLLIYYVPLVFSFFPWTQGLAQTVFEYVLAPLRQVGRAFVGYIPNVFYIAVIVVVTHYLVRFIRLFFDGLDSGAIHLPAFYADWAIPTFKIVRFLVFVFALILILPYLPGSGSDAFKGVSVFFGILLSLGSAGAIGNAMAGIAITYMRAFKLGDRVKIADTEGDVIERTLLVTRVRTPKHVEITIPNAMVLASHIVNYSAAAQEGGVILHTGVTIGYDTPWRQVHELLLAAAGRTDGLLREPPPFVLQTALSDFYVAYQLNAYTTEPNRMSRIYSELHEHIQDEFQRAGVQITSPHYEGDPARPKVPPPYPR